MQERGWAPWVHKKKSRNARIGAKAGHEWEKVTHLTIMLGGGAYSAGSDSAPESMVPFGDITEQNLASLNVFLCGFEAFACWQIIRTTTALIKMILLDA